MDQSYTPMEPEREFAAPPPPKKNNNTVIIVIVVILVLCCCCTIIGGAGWFLWNNGDSLMREFSQLPLHLLTL